VLDEFGFLAGAKGISEGVKSGKEAGKIIGSSIEDAQNEVFDVAQKQAQARIRARREAELKKERALIKALDEWKRKKQISDEEAKLKIDFVKKYGAKEWEAVLKIKLDIDNIERKNNEEYQHDVREVRRVMWMCVALAALIAYYLTWGYKQF
jgi:hypothetical protein